MSEKKRYEAPKIRPREKLAKVAESGQLIVTGPRTQDG